MLTTYSCPPHDSLAYSPGKFRIYAPCTELLEAVKVWLNQTAPSQRTSPVLSLSDGAIILKLHNQSPHSSHSHPVYRTIDVNVASAAVCQRSPRWNAGRAPLCLYYFSLGMHTLTDSSRAIAPPYDYCTQATTNSQQPLCGTLNARLQYAGGKGGRVFLPSALRADRGDDPSQ